MDKQAEHVRDQLIVRTSLVAIGTNLCLVAFKMAVGLLANSIAIVLQLAMAIDYAIIFCHQDPPFFKTGFQPQVHHALKKFLFVRRFSRIDFKLSLIHI